MSGLWEEIHHTARHGASPAKKPIRTGGPGTRSHAEGMDVSALERVTGIKEGTLCTCLTRAGMQAEKIHTHFFQELIFRHIQLDELWANLDHKNQEVWLWVATEASSILIPVIELGPRTLDMAMGVFHALGCTKRPGCLPIFTTDGFKLYFYALAAHYGQWILSEGAGKPVWQVAAARLSPVNSNCTGVPATFALWASALISAVC